MKKTKLLPVFFVTFALTLAGCTGNNDNGNNNNPPVVETGNDGSLEHPFTAQEASIKCDEAGANKIVENKMFYVEGIFDAGTKADEKTSLWTGSLDNTGFVISNATLSEGMKVNDVDGKLDGKKVLAYGYIGNFNGKCQMAQFATDGNKVPTIITIDGSATYVDPNYIEPVIVDKNDGTYEKPFTVQEAYDKMVAAGAGVIVDNKEYYVKGTLDTGTTYNSQYNEFYGVLEGKINICAEVGEKMNVTPKDGALDGKEILIKGYMELYNDQYKISFLPASASPTGNAYTPKFIEINGKDDYDDGYVKVDVMQEYIDKLFATATNKVTIPSTGVDTWDGIAILEDDYYACASLTPNINAYAENCGGQIGSTSLEDTYKKVLDAASGWYRLDNDEDDFLNYDSFGYIYGNSASFEDSTIIIQFYCVEEENNTITFWYWIINDLCEYTGHYTDYEGNELPFWHEILTDPEYGYVRGEFPKDDLKEKLGISGNVYSFYENDTCSLFFPEESGVDEETGEPYYSAREYQVCYNPILINYIFDDMEEAGLDVQYDLFGGATVYNAEHTYQITVTAYYEDEDSTSPYVLVLSYQNVADLYSTELSTATEWTADEKATIASVLGDIELPFMRLGAEGAWEADVENNFLSFCDYYYLDLMPAYGEMLVAAGFEYTPYDEDTMSGDYYSLTKNGSNVVVYLYWCSLGNFIYMYYTPAPSQIILNKTEAEVKQGKTLQLEATFGPEGCNTEGLTVTWSSDAPFATVNSNGLVTIADDAPVGDTAYITASCNGLSAKCLVTVAEAGTTEAGWYKVTDASTLKAGDKIVFVCESKGTICDGALVSGKKFMGYTTATFADGQITSEVPMDYAFTLGGTSGAWTLSNANGYLNSGTSKVSLAFGTSSTTTWSISIDASGNAAVDSSQVGGGKILYNSNAGSERFANYTSAPKDNMLLPNIYVYVD